MGIILNVSDLRGPPRTTLRTPWVSMDPRLRSHDLDHVLQDFSIAKSGKLHVYIFFCRACLL